MHVGTHEPKGAVEPRQVYGALKHQSRCLNFSFLSTTIHTFSSTSECWQFRTVQPLDFPLESRSNLLNPPEGYIPKLAFEKPQGYVGLETFV